MQAWQLGKTSDGSNLIRVSSAYAAQVQDEHYVEAVKLFIAEEQKHGANLGLYLDAIGEKRLKRDIGDTLFRKVRNWNSSMEVWTVTVIIVESFAQLYYKAIADATSCRLLQQICEDILMDEAHQIRFQLERLCVITSSRSRAENQLVMVVYRMFFHTVFLAIWIGHGKVFRAGGLTFSSLLKMATQKFNFIVDRLTSYQYMVHKLQPTI